jgi:hypothetical protein
VRASAFRIVAGLVASALWLTASSAAAIEREHVLRFISPEGAIEGFRVFLGPESGVYTDDLDLGLVPTDADGITRASLLLDAGLGYYVAMTAYDGSAESDYSNEIFVPPSSCDPSACDDGDPCTADDCATGACTHTPVGDGTVCGSDFEVCLGGSCSLVDCFSDADCSNGDACDGTEGCYDYFCEMGSELACVAPTQCSEASCSANTGCWVQDLPDGTPCDDGLADTLDDACAAGVCIGSAAQQPECVHDSDCADADACNGSEFCWSDGRCYAGPAPVCDEPTQCTESICDPLAGCQSMPLPNGTPCDDGLADTLDDACAAGACIGSAAQQPECVQDSDCADADACNGSEFCWSDGRCYAEPAPVCDEPTQCTESICDPLVGCLSMPLPDGTPCDDGWGRSHHDYCEAGRCIGKIRGSGRGRRSKD